MRKNLNKSSHYCHTRHYTTNTSNHLLAYRKGHLMIGSSPQENAGTRVCRAGSRRCRSPQRQRTAWADFPHRRANALTADGFVETRTLAGARLYAVAVIEHATRRVRIPGVGGDAMVGA
jgi:hypothetical protein